MSKKRGALLLPVIAVIALLLMVAWMAGYFTDKIEPGLAGAVTPDAAAIADAITVAVVEGPFSESVPASVEAKETTIISSRLLARITGISVRAGDYVEEGQLLLELEKTDLLARAQQTREQIRSVQARLTEAQQNLQRAQELHQRGLIASADRDAARANADALQADLASAKQALQEAETAVGFTEIHSPIAGRVVDRFAEPGDTASPGEKILSLYNPFSLRVEARVREQLAMALTAGQQLQVIIPVRKQSLTGRIEEIVPAADPGSRSFLVKVILPAASNLLPGMYAHLQVPAGTRTRLLIPAERVAQVGQLDVVWVLEGGAVKRRFVKLGQPAEDALVEVVAGLQAGDTVLPMP